MDEVLLYFETQAQSALPALRAGSVAAARFGAAELRELEQELNRRYERLCRGTVRTLNWNGHQFTVSLADGPNPRQPRLTLKLAQPGAAADPDRPPAWAEGFLHELEQLTAGLGERGALPGPELAGLRFALDELRAVAGAAPAELSRLLLASYLQVTGQLCRPRDEERAVLYSLALRGLGTPSAEAATVMDEAGSNGAPVAARPAAPSHGWLLRLFNRLLGLGASELDAGIRE